MTNEILEIISYSTSNVIMFTIYVNYNNYEMQSRNYNILSHNYDIKK